MKKLVAVIAKVLKSEPAIELASVKEIAKNNRTTFWTSLILALFSLCVAVGNTYLVVDLTDKKSEEKESLTVLKLLSNAENDVYKARAIIYEREELEKSQGNNDGSVDMGNEWSVSKAMLPYPEALTIAMNEKSVLMKLSQTGLNTLNDYKKQLDNDRNLIMDPSFSTFIKPSVYTSYKGDLQDLTSMLQQEIRFQKSEVDEKSIAAFYLALEEKRVEQIQNNIKENDIIADQLEEGLSSQNSRLFP